MANSLSVLKRGRQTIQVYHKNFEYYRPNTHKCGDCAIRAVAKALDVSWEVHPPPGQARRVCDRRAVLRHLGLRREARLRLLGQGIFRRSRASVLDLQL